MADGILIGKGAEAAVQIWPRMANRHGLQRARTPTRGNRKTPVEAFARSAMRSLGTQIDRQIVRGVTGSLFGGTRRRRG